MSNSNEKNQQDQRNSEPKRTASPQGKAIHQPAREPYRPATPPKNYYPNDKGPTQRANGPMYANPQHNNAPHQQSPYQMNNQHQPKQNYSNMQTSPYQQQPNYMNNSNPYGMPQGMGNPSAMPQNQNWQGGPSGYPSQPPTGMQPMMGGGMPSGGLPRERSYIENILRLNRGKNATVYMTFENNDQWNAEVFTGIIEEAGKDHIVLADPETGTWYLLLMIYLDYITFNEEIEYEYPFNG